jgi:SynChlorMet cassette protein ScmD
MPFKTGYNVKQDWRIFMADEKRDKPLVNPSIILREEFDDWAVLFDPDTAQGYALNPVGVLIWKQLDGTRTLDDIVAAVRSNCEEVPGDVREHCRSFIDDLVKQGLAGYEVTR